MIRPATVAGSAGDNDGESVCLFQEEGARDDSAGRRPDCSRPRTGSSSAQTTMPRRSSGLIGQLTYSEIPRRELIPILRISTAKSSPKRLHPSASLVSVKQVLNQPCRREPTLLRAAVDAIPQLGRNLDRRHAHNTSIRLGITPQRHSLHSYPQRTGSTCSVDRRTRNASTYAGSGRAETPGGDVQSSGRPQTRYKPAPSAGLQRACPKPLHSRFLRSWEPADLASAIADHDTSGCVTSTSALRRATFSPILMIRDSAARPGTFDASPTYQACPREASSSPTRQRRTISLRARTSRSFKRPPPSE